MYPEQTIRRFFAGITEHAFHCRLGVADPPLVDYLTDMLMRFVRTDVVFKVRAPNGRRLDQVVEMLIEAQARQGTAAREVHQHIGDYTLFWSGMFPEAVEKMCKPGRKDSLVNYQQQGKRAYHIASTISAEIDDAETEVFRRLSHEFELCAYGLGEVRREWERRDNGGDSLLQLIN